MSDPTRDPPSDATPEPTPEGERPRLPPVVDVFADDRLRRAAAAAEAGDLPAIRALGPLDLDAVQPAGVNLLMYEIATRHETAVRTLLDAGADPNLVTPEGMSPMLVAGGAEDTRWLGLLVDKGGDPDLKTRAGEPLLTLLVPYGRWESMLFLLDHGAQIDAAGPSEQTATYKLGTLHQFQRVSTMLDRGADPAHADVNGLKLRDFVLQPTAPDSPEEPWRQRVAARIGVRIGGSGAEAG